MSSTPVFAQSKTDSKPYPPESWEAGHLAFFAGLCSGPQLTIGDLNKIFGHVYDVPNQKLFWQLVIVEIKHKIPQDRWNAILETCFEKFSFPKRSGA